MVPAGPSSAYAPSKSPSGVASSDEDDDEEEDDEQSSSSSAMSAKR